MDCFHMFSDYIHAIMMECFHMFSDYVHEVPCPRKSNVQYHNAQCIPQAHTPCRLSKAIIKATLNMYTSCPLPHLSLLLAVAIHHRHGRAYCYCHDQ